MKYIELANYHSAWMFLDEGDGDGVADSDLSGIKPLSEDSSSEFWAMHISQTNRHPMLLRKGDWLTEEGVLSPIGTWMDDWNSEEMTIPKDLENALDWEDEDVVYFAYAKEDVIETTWAVFKRSWKYFLLEDEGPYLICLCRKQLVAFGPSGQLSLASMR